VDDYIKKRLSEIFRIKWKTFLEKWSIGKICAEIVGKSEEGRKMHHWLRGVDAPANRSIYIYFECWTCICI